mgnify:CR=1 FL=1
MEDSFKFDILKHYKTPFVTFIMSFTSPLLSTLVISNFQHYHLHNYDSDSIS